VADATASPGRSSTLPSVAHFLREFARPTETFVVNQIDGLTRYQGFVMCRSRLAGAPVPFGGKPLERVRAFADETRESRRANLAYRWVRFALRTERRWYREAVVGEGSVVVHAHFGTDAGYVWPAIRATGRPLLVSWYGYDVTRFPRVFGGAGALWLRSVLKGARLHLAMTPTMADALASVGAPRDSIRVHHHGIDLREWSSAAAQSASKRGGRRLLMVAAFDSEKKGHDDLVRALALVAQTVPDVVLRFVGAGPLLDDTRRLAAELGVASRITFVGHVPHGDALLREYEEADVFVHPSRTASNGDQEGLPSTILEAMACGLPVVSTRHGGIPFAVTQDVGALVAERDPAGLAREIAGLLENGARARAMGSAGRERIATDFDLKRQVSQLEDIYDEVR
jgi:colanic acid/amylovoran biosynthesis glycosyltransferase